MKPNYSRLNECLEKHPDYVFESEVRDKLCVIDFTDMTEKEMDEFHNWLSEKGYEVAEYVDKKSRLLDSVWINEKHQEAIEHLHSLRKQFETLHNHRRANVSKNRVDKIADEGMEIITTLNSMVLAKSGVA